MTIILRFMKEQNVEENELSSYAEGCIYVIFTFILFTLGLCNCVFSC
jgi:hypothetical protein